MSKELIKKYDLRIYCGIFLSILGIILGVYFLSKLISRIEGGNLQGWGMMYLNFLFFSIACIIFPGICLIFINNKKKKRLFKKPKITETDLAYLKRLIYHYLEENQSKAFTTNALRDKLADKIENQLLKRYFEENIDQILNKMKIDGSIQIVEKNEINYNILS